MCKPAPVAQQVYADAKAAHPEVTYLGIVGDQAHQTRRSSHNCAPMQESGNYDPNYAHAVDIGVGTNRALAHQILAVLTADPRTRYCIYDAVIYYPGGSTSRGSGHPTHVHWSGRPGTTHDTRPFNFAPDNGGFGTMTDAEILKEFANVTKRTAALITAALADTADQAKRHNAAARERDTKIIALLNSIEAKL